MTLLGLNAKSNLIEISLNPRRTAQRLRHHHRHFSRHRRSPRILLQSGKHLYRAAKGAKIYGLEIDDLFCFSALDLEYGFHGVICPLTECKDDSVR